MFATAAEDALDAGVQTALEGGSFGQALEGDAVASLAADVADAIGGNSAPASVKVAEHAALGCATGAVLGSGCEAGAIGGATSAIISPVLVNEMGGAANLTNEQRALITAIAMISGGSIAGAAGQDAIGAALSAENEALNNSEREDHGEHAFNPAGKPDQEGVAAENGSVKIVPGTSAPPSDAGDGDETNVSIGKGLPVGPGLSATNTTSALQQASTLFSSNAPGSLQIGGATFTELPNSGNAKLFSGASDAQVQQYFLQLSGASALPEPIPLTIQGVDGVRYTIVTPSGNFTLRDVSSSQSQTGPTWTIEVPQAAIGTTSNKEIKFLQGTSN